MNHRAGSGAVLRKLPGCDYGSGEPRDQATAASCTAQTKNTTAIACYLIDIDLEYP